MKKIITIIFLLFMINLHSQDNLFLRVKEQLKKDYPELRVDNKLIFINVWSPDDQQSRESNKQVSKTIQVYEGARLKGGRAGIIAVLICRENDNSPAIILNKDEVKKAVSLGRDLLSPENNFSNIMFDSEGKQILLNLKPEAIFEGVHNLVTR